MNLTESQWDTLSASARGLWIEILKDRKQFLHAVGQLPRGGCGLKSNSLEDTTTEITSASARGLWIEIS